MLLKMVFRELLDTDPLQSQEGGHWLSLTMLGIEGTMLLPPKIQTRAL
jgi:hypothetical protein